MRVLLPAHTVTDGNQQYSVLAVQNEYSTPLQAY